MLTIKINTKGAAFTDDIRERDVKTAVRYHRNQEAARILREVATLLENNPIDLQDQSVRNLAGALVGTLTINNR